MRHRKGFNHLGRTSAHRKAMLSNMASSLILHKRITTTTAKAKELRSYIEPLITKSKDDTTHSRRVVFSHLKNKFAVAELFREVSPKVMERPGGYTRILKTGNRLGDNADMCIVELVDYNENMLGDTGKKAKTTRRRRGSGKAKTEADATPKTGKASPAAAELPAGGGEPEAPVSSSEESAADIKAEVKDKAPTEEIADAGDDDETREEITSETVDEISDETVTDENAPGRENRNDDGDKSESSDKEEDKKE